MLAESADGIGVLTIGVRIRHADDDRPEAPVVAAAGRKHGGNQRIAFIVPERQKQWHFALDVGFKTDLLLNIDL